MNGHIAKLVLAALTVTASTLNGAATRIAYVDPFATARGNAFTATADSPSAVFYNAAGLTQLEGTQFQANVFAISLAYEYDGPNGTDEMDDSFQAVPSLFLAHNFEELPIALGFGIYAPFALGADWQRDANFTEFSLDNIYGPALPYDSELAYIKYHGVIAWQVTESLSVAAGLSFDDSEVDFVARAVEFTGTDQKIGYSFSVMWQPSQKHSFGLNYQGATRMDFEGEANYLGFLEFDTTASLDFPESIIFGYSYRPTEKWNFEFNLDWTNWDKVDDLVLDGPPLPALLTTYELNWESAFIWELGATRYFENGWHLSAGYTFVENAVPDEDLLPAVPDSDRHFFAVGVGKKNPRLSWQLTYQYAYDDGREISENGYGLEGEWKLESHALTGSLNFKF